MFRRIALIGTVISAATGIAFLTARQRFHGWGINPAETTRELPGDDLVTEPTTTDTRGIDIAAPTEQVWPWLVQMGYKRAGWYSYDAIENHASSREIVPEFQHLEVGQVMPTHPGGGFIAKIVEPGKALVLYLDSATVREQSKAQAAVKAAEHPAEETPTETAPNLEATGKFLNTAMPGEFAASWTFVLEPTFEGGTRLIERFRVHLEVPTTRPATVLAPFLGFGVFAMTHRQMLGIRSRAQAALRSTLVPPPEPYAA